MSKALPRGPIEEPAAIHLIIIFAGPAPPGPLPPVFGFVICFPLEYQKSSDRWLGQFPYLFVDDAG